MTKSQKMMAIGKTFTDNKERYKPSFHVYRWYYDSLAEDVLEGVESFRIVACSIAEDVFQTADQVEHLNDEYPDINPEPMFYMDETNPEECFMVIEEYSLDMLQNYHLKLMAQEAQAFMSENDIPF